MLKTTHIHRVMSTYRFPKMWLGWRSEIDISDYRRPLNKRDGSLLRFVYITAHSQSALVRATSCQSSRTAILNIPSFPSYAALGQYPKQSQAAQLSAPFGWGLSTPACLDHPPF